MMIARSTNNGLLAELAETGPIRTAVAMVVAHQDDETIAAGGTIARMLDLTLIHITDGAPLDLAISQAHGFETRAAYSAARALELEAALTAACARPVRRLCYAVPDGEVAGHFDEIVERLAADLMPAEAVITHPYEGGHVDHDACARAVHMAVAILQNIMGRSPTVFEFASYYLQHGIVRAGLFWPEAGSPEVEIRLSSTALCRREAAFHCFKSQSGNLGYFSLDTERFRRAPAYDFSLPPPPRRR